ncbi:protein phosphatase 2C domain-containing protein [Intrasporangium sp.]|uniref:protein phosphatase 2C domain-containing protein n=1 Tax=Intrasporangium sp. TaxID=1925024 RepID=UPI0032218532
MTHPAQPRPSCPSCGAAHDPGASFCEACGADLTGHASALTTPDPLVAAATPQTAPAGDESPLDTGWTGVVPDDVAPQPDDRCRACGQGRIVDGYCDQCGTPPPDPRDHFTQAPTTWVAGVCDIGRRHTRNEDAMALWADEPAGRRAVLVVCDGVSMATDSHIASLAAAQEARDHLSRPLPRGAGTPEAWVAATGRALTAAVLRANEAVKATVTDHVPNPPSCTFAAAVVEDGTVVAGTVGDSRVYWLPDDAGRPARQLGEDDSFAAERIRAGVPREQAENGPQAHSITRWLGSDAPDDLTPHLATVAPRAPGWLLVCSDGLWNYCSEPEAVRGLVATAAAGVGHEPGALAQALVDFANEQGGRDNITVALARLAGRGSTVSNGAQPPQEEDPSNG